MYKIYTINMDVQKAHVRKILLIMRLTTVF
jgi:hypothetical protein